MTEESIKPKRGRHRYTTMEDVRYVHQHYAEKSAPHIGEELGISKFQVSKIVSDLRAQGVDIPKKRRKRGDPVQAFLEEECLKSKKKAPRKAARKRAPKKAAPKE